MFRERFFYDLSKPRDLMAPLHDTSATVEALHVPIRWLP